MSEDIWAFLSKGAGPDDWYTAEKSAALDDYIRAFKHIASMETTND